MLTRIVKETVLRPLRGFGAKKKATPAPEAEAPTAGIVKRAFKWNALGRERMKAVSEVAVMEYKEYPAKRIAHFNHDSPKFVDAHRDEEELNTEVTAFNNTIDELKTNLRLQEEVYGMIEKMDRPYLRGVKGLETNVYDRVKDYSNPTGHNNESPQENEQNLLKAASNKHRFINDAVFNYKFLSEMSNIKAWQQEIDSRPVTSNFHLDKGYKFDVEVPKENRYPHVADRLGYPELLGTDIERLFRLENEYLHPGYLDQPFVQTPPINPNAELTFEEGEVVYENPNVHEIAKFTEATGAFGLFSWLVWQPYSMLRSSIPNPDAYEDLPLPYFDQSYLAFDNYLMTLVGVPLVVYFAINLTMVFLLLTGREA